MRPNPDATFDCLFVAHYLQRRNQSFAVSELHIFAYLACLLWLYRHRAVTDWGYEFVGTELGAPFSQQTDAAIRELIEHGYFLRINERLRLTEDAEQLLRDLGQLSFYQDRNECLEAACASTIEFSVGMVTSALSHEPELRRAQGLPVNRALLEESGRAQIYSHFDALRKGISKHSNDLRLPAVVWLAALYRSGESATDQA